MKSCQLHRNFLYHTTTIVFLLFLTIHIVSGAREVLPIKFVHHNNTEMDIILDTLAAKFPNITRLYTIGKTYQGKKLRVLEITEDPGKHIPGKPEFKYIANMHGNEVVGRELLLLLAEHLCEGYGRLPGITQLMETTRIHLLPSMNPDGWDAATEGDCTSVVGRFNANGVDLNRNFPDPYDRRLNSLQPETRAIMNWLKSEPFVLSANLHGGTLVANYPYDNIPSELKRSTVRVYYGSPDDDVFVKISKAYSLAHPTMHKGEPQCPIHKAERFKDGITNGAAWYPISGGMQDYNYYFTNCFAITLELGCCKFPPARYMKDYWFANRGALLNYINMVHTTGIRGFVNDEDGNPISDVKIIVGDRTKKIKTFKDGDFWRLLTPGKYLVKARKRGYKHSRKIVQVYNETSTVINFTLVAKHKPSKPVELNSIVDKSEKKLSFHVSESQASKLKLSVNSKGQSTRSRFVTCLLCLVGCFLWPKS
ncbi:hypothetical protein QZH41_010737 [Actinostola sp. cb2023]|nr:hypothetical protein QZH41_010737 [Actinostola sp. cb2023]